MERFCVLSYMRTKNNNRRRNYRYGRNNYSNNQSQLVCSQHTLAIPSSSISLKGLIATLKLLSLLPFRRRSAACRGL